MQTVNNKIKFPLSYHILRFLSFFALFVFMFTLGIFKIIKWLFAPIMFALNLLVYIPIGKLTIKVPIKAKSIQIEEATLPTAVWLAMKETECELASYGFSVGCYVLNKNSVPKMDLYFMSLVNHEKSQGVGMTVLVPNNLKADEIEEDDLLQTVEFSLQNNQGKIIDISNSSQLLPLPLLDNRQYIYFREGGTQGLYQFYKKYKQANQCYLPANILDQLENNPEKILQAEALTVINHGIRQGFLKTSKDHYSLTWKGAFQSGLRTVWPSSDWYHYLEKKKTDKIMNDIGLSMNDLWKTVEEGNLQPLKKKVISQQQVVKIAEEIIKDIHQSANMITMLVLNPEDKNPEFRFEFQHIKKYKERTVSYILDDVLIIDTDKQTYTLNRGCPDFYVAEDMEYFKEGICTPLVHDLRGYLDVEQAIKIAKSNGFTLISELQLGIEDGESSWIIYGQDVDDEVQSISIHAQTGKVSDGGETMFF